MGCVELAKVWLIWVPQVYVALAYDNGAPHSRMPPIGWSSWVALGRGWDTTTPEPATVDFCDEVSVRASIDAYFEVGLYEAGYRHFRLDDCWADKHRNASGYLQADRVNFPNGLRPLIDYAHGRGLTFGLYTCAGPRTCAHGRMGSKGHFEQDAALFAEWKVDLVKMDWCGTQGMQPQETFTSFSAALNSTGRPIHLNMCEWGYDEPFEWGPSVAQSWRATGDHHGTWSSTVVAVEVRALRIPDNLGGAPYAWNDLDLLQTGNYHQAGRPDYVAASMTATEYRTEFSMWAILASPLVVTTPLLNCSSTDDLRGNFTPTRCRPSLTALQKEILLNKEVLDINQDVTPGARRVWPRPTASATTMKGHKGNCSVFYKYSNDPCILDHDFGCIPEANTMWVANKCRGLFTCNGVKEVLCPTPTRQSDASSGNTTCDCLSHEPAPGVQVFVRNLSNGDAAVALYNPDGQAAGPFRLNFTMAGFDKGTSVKVRNLWKHADMGVFQDFLPDTSVQPHETILLRVSPQGTFVEELLV